MFPLLLLLLLFRALPPPAGEAFLPDEGPCRPIVGRGADLPDLLLDCFAVDIFEGGGTLGGMERVKGVLAGVCGGVGGLPFDGCCCCCCCCRVGSAGDVARGLRNIGDLTSMRVGHLL